MYISIIVAIIMLLGTPLTTLATVVDHDDDPEEQIECEERSDYDSLCSGSGGATGIPFCDKYNSTQRAQQFPNLTNPSHCLNRENNPIKFCQEFDDLTLTYEYCRNVPGSEEYFEYAKTGGPDESCLFDVTQLKCLAFPNNMNETAPAQCPEGFFANEDDRCVPLHREGCPEGYHSEDEDESGQCYPDSEGCYSDSYVLLERENGTGSICRLLSNICEEAEHMEEDYCIEFCEDNPDAFACDPQAVAQKQAELEANAKLWCDGKPRNYSGLEDLPKLEENECYGPCEVLSRGLACDIEKRRE